MHDDPQLQQMALRMRSLRAGRNGAIFLPPPLPVRPPAPEPARDDDMLTLAEAARLARVSVPTLKKWGVPVFKSGRVVRVERRALRTFIAGRTLTHDDDIDGR